MKFALLFLTLFLRNAHALEIADLKSGDIILQSIPCYICALIELEEGAPYSHMGVVLKTETSLDVLQAWTSVEELPIQTTLSFRKPHTSTLVLRAIDPNGNEISFDTEKLAASFAKNFNGLSYDSDFLWNNTDAKGEKLYCSEFVTKFLNPFLPVAIPTKPMHFTHDRPDWITYFHGTPPDGQPGNSPADFSRSNLFKTLGEIRAN